MRLALVRSEPGLRVSDHGYEPRVDAHVSGLLATNVTPHNRSIWYGDPQVWDHTKLRSLTFSLIGVAHLRS